ncbi:MAG: glycine C-acetyltransferase, partial [Rhodobacteraceae bacterium]|nr:glycine C-acetyltransferase [Paracoccaceae bacterium]
YLFSNSLPPSIVAAGLRAIELVTNGDALREQLFENTAYWRAGLERLGFDLLPGEHPIVPVMLGEARLAQDMAARLFEEGVYVSGFFFPVVPRGQARIRTQMNAALSREELDRALEAFATAGKACGVIQ